MSEKNEGYVDDLRGKTLSTQGNIENNGTQFHWRSYSFKDQYDVDVREKYFIEFMFGPARIYVPYVMVLECVDKMELSLKENNGHIPFVQQKEYKDE